MIDKLLMMPLGIYAPLWIAWSIACWLLFRRCLPALLLLTSTMAASVFLWPWPLYEPAVLPPALVFALAAGAPVLVGWWIVRRTGAGAGRWAMAAPLAAGAALLGATGAVQAWGRTEAGRPTPARSKIVSGALSADGSHLVLQPIGNHPTLGGTEGARMSSWIVATDSGALLRDGYLQEEYSLYDFIRPGLIRFNPKASTKGIWALDIETGEERMLALDRSKLMNKHVWRAAPANEGFVDIFLPGEAEPTQVPWSGPMKYGPEQGVLYGREDGELVRFDALGGTKTILAPVPGHLTDREWSFSISPLGDALKLSTPDQGTRILSSSDGTVLYELPERWWSAWTGGPRPLAIARPPRRDEDGVRLPFRPVSQWIDASGARPFELPRDGKIISSASGRVFLLGDAVTELAADGSLLRTLNIQPIEGGAAR